MATAVNSVAGSNLTTALGGAPGANDTVLLNQGNENYTAGVDISTNAIDLFAALPGYGGNMGWDGSSVSYVKIKTSAAGVVNLNWSGERAYIQGTGGVGTGLLFQVNVEPARNGQVFISDSALTNLAVRGGLLTAVTSGCTVTNVYATAGTTQLQLGGATCTLAECSGTAKLDVHRAVTTLTVSGGTASVLLDTITPTTCNLNGGTLVYAGGNITTGNFRGGVLDLTKLTKALTLTTTNWLGPVTVLLSRSGIGEPSWGTQNRQVPPRIVYV